MMLGRVMLREVVAQVFAAWGPVDFKVALIGSVTDPIKAHVDGFQRLLLYSAVNDAIYGGVVCLEWGGGLMVAHFAESCTSTVASLAFRNSAPTSASAAEDLTLRRILATLRMGPLGVGLGLLARSPRK
jgi:hypothetical protein